MPSDELAGKKSGMGEEGIFSEAPGEKESTSCERRDRQHRESSKKLLGYEGRKLEREKPSLNYTCPQW